MALRGTRTSIVRQKHRRLIARMYCQGMWQTQIAERLGISQSQVSWDLQVVQRWWQKSAVMDFHKARTKELAKIDNLEMEYWTAWRRSMGKARIVTVKGRGSKPKETDVERTIREEQVTGDPRFLDGVMKCIQKRIDLLGLDEPKRHEVEISAKFTNEERADRLARLLERGGIGGNGRLVGDDVHSRQ
ncbi:MAG: hypothetical protein ACE5IR_23870 [bacterium]